MGVVWDSRENMTVFYLVVPLDRCWGFFFGPRFIGYANLEWIMALALLAQALCGLLNGHGNWRVNRGCLYPYRFCRGKRSIHIMWCRIVGHNTARPKMLHGQHSQSIRPFIASTHSFSLKVYGYCRTRNSGLGLIFQLLIDPASGGFLPCCTETLARTNKPNFMPRNFIE